MTAVPAPHAARRAATKTSPPPASKADLPTRILAGFKSDIQPVRAGPLYLAGLALVATAMLVLPLIYIAIVALVAYGVFWHATQNISIFTGPGGGARGKFLAYVTPLVVGIILLVFMVKPLFARRVRSHPPLSLSREEEPLLFAFVERLCQIVGAPVPRRIDVDTQVNASASFMGGVWGLFTNRLVLTVGLPLVAGLDLRQLAGVVAHEFGHFTQGFAMRLDFVVRTINMWFAHLVYERDEWDYKLARLSAHVDWWGFTLVVLVAQLCVWVTRRVLWVLMFVGHLISSFMSRQMEFDADKCQARVAGADAFAQTFERVNLLALASQAAFGDLDAAWRERRLCDNLPSLIRNREKDMPPEVRKKFLEATGTSTTGWFDSHPADPDRVRAVEREAAPGIFKLKAPASILFRDFDELSRRATVAFYFQAIGPEFRPQNIVATEEIVAASTKRREDVTAMRRYFCDLLHPVRPVFPERFDTKGTGVRDPAAAAEQLLALRSNLCALAPDAADAVKAWDKADDRLVALERLRELITAGVRLPKVDLKELGLARLGENEVQAGLREVAGERDAARQKLDRVLAGGMERLSLALSLEKSLAAAAPAAPTRAPSTEDSYDLADQAAPGSDDRLLDALRVLREAASDVESLRRHFNLLGMVLSQVQPGQNPQSLIDTVLWHSRKCSDLLRCVHGILRGAAYPYSHAHKQVSVAQYAATSLPPAEEPVDVFKASDSAVDAVYSLYVRLISDLSARAEKVEESLGLPKLPDPPQNDADNEGSEPAAAGAPHE